MKRIYPDYAYGTGPRENCWWDETCVLPETGLARGPLRCDVAIVGGGFTGLNAALHLARAGVDVALFDANRIGWGASGRNGGFCCLGGGRIGNTALERRFGFEGRAIYRAAEKASVAYVGALLDAEGIDADRHSRGETSLAHRPKDARAFEKQAAEIEQDYGVTPEILSNDKMQAGGLNGPFHGALTIPIGFGMNPLKYLAGLGRAALQAGARVFAPAQITSIDQHLRGYALKGTEFDVIARKVIIATNGYSSETVPQWMAGRYMPSQSSVIVTRPLRDAELAAQGWTSDQMAYDTRNLLHYFRLMPDKRFLFGMRGGLSSGARAEARALVRVRRDFEQMFPAWRGVETSNGWSGMVCLARDQLPVIGPVPDQPDMFAGFAYHGNGVAMGSYAGRILADLVLEKTPETPYSAEIFAGARKFPFGRFRRALLPPAYAGFAWADR